MTRFVKEPGLPGPEKGSGGKLTWPPPPNLQFIGPPEGHPYKDYNPIQVHVPPSLLEEADAEINRKKDK